MRKELFRLLLFTCMLFSVFSCVVDDDGPKFTVAVVPIDSVEVPESFTIGKSYPIKVKYKRLSTCHSFAGFYYDINGPVRTVAVQNFVVERDDCEPLNDASVEVSFNFTVESYNSQSCLFKFYTGDDAQGNPTYMNVEVPVQ